MRNDSWFIAALSAYKDFELSVFNRYGEIVFHLRNENLPWHGKYRRKPVPIGVYDYIVDFKSYSVAGKENRDDNKINNECVNRASLPHSFCKAGKDIFFVPVSLLLQSGNQVNCEGYHESV